MAIVTVDFFSKYLLRNVTFTALLPLDKVNIHGKEIENISEKRSLKTLYLLHGIFGDHMDWLTGTRIRRWAQNKNLAVVMPSGDNHFYVDCAATGEAYGQFIGEELVEFTRSMFPLSHDREDTFIGGLSMGGYGALRNGLKYSEVFGRVCAFSAGVNDKSKILTEETEKSPLYTSRKSFFEAIHGDISHLPVSDRDCRKLILQNKESGRQIPKIYMCCGTEDFLLESNRAYCRFLKDQDVTVTYEEGPGAHEWDFWDTYLKRALDWLPLEEKQKGIDSGNVREKGRKDV